MPRPERPLDPAGGPVAEFAAELRRLRQTAGSPGYRQLARKAHFSATTLAEAAAGRRLPTLDVTLAFVDACAGDRDEWAQRWRTVAAKIDATTPRADSDDDDASAPYLGLAAYQPEDVHLFFGRDRLIDDLAVRLATRRFLAVFGPSGCGKSSLLRAGLVPAVRARYSWQSLVITPGAAPLTELARRVGQLTGAGWQPGGPDPHDLPALVEQAVADQPAQVRVLLVIDQFEEIFTLCRDERERTGFVAALLALADSEGDRLRVVIGVRADFYAACAGLPGLVAGLRDAQVLIGPMTATELREAIVRPAERAGLMVEGALVSTIVAEMAGKDGGLPLLSHTLLEVWRCRRGSALTLTGYEAAGGIEGALAQTAEALYARLAPPQQETLREILLRLVAFGEGVGDTRRRAGRAELDFAEAGSVLERMADKRLIVLGEDTAEIAHEALITAWPRLHRWLHTDREGLRLHRQLTDAAATWNSLDRDPDALYRGTRLASWNGRGLDRLNELERAFLTAGRDREKREHAFRRRRSRLVLASLTIAVVLMSALAVLALAQARRANEERDLALSRQLVANARGQSQTDQEAALLLAELAYDTKPTPEAQSALRQAIEDFRGCTVVQAGQGLVLGVAFSPDGNAVASSGADGTTRVWRRAGQNRLQGPARILRGHQGNVLSPVFSADGRRLAAGGIDGIVTVWDLTSGDAPLVLGDHAGKISTVAFSPDGQRLAGAGADGTVRVWSAPGYGAPLVLRPGGPVSSVAFSADGRFLAAGGDAGIWLWPASGKDEPRLLRGHEGPVKNIAFSPDGQRLASVGSDDHTVRVWRTTGTEAPLVLRAQDGSIENVAFSPDGLRVAVGYSRGAVRVWSATTTDDPLVLHGHSGPVWSVAFSPDGQRLASASNDGTLRLWDPAYGGHPAVLGHHDGSAWTVAVQGHRVASGGEDGTVRVWSYPDPRPPVVLRGHVGEVLAVAVSRDGRRIASGGRDGTLRIWDADAGSAVVLRGHTLGVISVAFSPDGRMIASASSDGSVRVWNADGHGEPLVLTGHKGTVRSVAFNPDGQHVASGGSDGTVRLWDITGKHQPTVLDAHPGGIVWSLAFSPDGTHLASGGHDSTVKIWNSDGSGQPLVLRGFQGIAWSVAYRPDGKQLATSGDEGGVHIWDTTDGRQLADVQGHNASVEQIAYTTDESNHLVTAHGDGTVRVWECETCGPADQVRALASTRTSRSLTREERDLFLNQPPASQ